MNKQNKTYKKQAFTLVELIVVITILAILSTIGFISYSGYLAGTRDVNRTSQLKSMSDALELYKTQKDLPLPDDSIEIKVNGTTIARQGYIGKNVLETIKYSSKGLDPKDKTYFSYYLTEDKKYFQLMAYLEEEPEQITSLNKNKIKLLNKTNALDYTNRYPTVFGAKLGILTDTNNTPVQEITTLQTSGLDITSSLTEEYIARFEDGEDGLQGSGTTLAELKLISKIGGNKTRLYSISGKSCKEILDKYIKAPDGVYTIKASKVFKTYCDMTTDGGGWTRVLFEDYESPVTGWSGVNTITSCGSFGNILGGYDILSTIDNTKIVDLLNITHSDVRVKLKYIEIDSWDNEEAYVKLDGTKIFSKSVGGSSGNPICGGGNNGNRLEQIDLVDATINHSNNSVSLTIGSGLNSPPSDESYGYDNLEVFVK